MSEWTDTPTKQGSYWMNFINHEGAAVSCFVVIKTGKHGKIDGRSRAKEGLWINGLHYWRDQFRDALFSGPISPPDPPDRTKEISGSSEADAPPPDAPADDVLPPQPIGG